MILRLRGGRLFAQGEHLDLERVIVGQARVAGHLGGDIEFAHSREAQRLRVELRGLLDVADDDAEIDGRSGELRFSA